MLCSCLGYILDDVDISFHFYIRPSLLLIYSHPTLITVFKGEGKVVWDWKAVVATERKRE